MSICKIRNFLESFGLLNNRPDQVWEEIDANAWL